VGAIYCRHEYGLAAGADGPGAWRALAPSAVWGAMKGL
jgi:hypothetical protein